MWLQKRAWGAIAILLVSSTFTLSQNLSIPTFPAGPNSLPFIAGQVVISDGTKLSESVEVQIICDSRARMEIYTDTQGNFNFDMAKLAGISGPQPADVSPNTGALNSNSPWDNCMARAALAGFASDTVEFSYRLQEIGIVDIGKVRLHPVNPGIKTSLSVSSLLAPKPARKAMDKGLRLERQRKWPEAEHAFKQAVEAYPQYAAAWSELGRMQYIQQNFSAAHESFQQAVEIDPQYVRPYLGLSQLAMDSHNWAELVRTSDKALALDSQSYPGMWLLNATGQYNLHNYDAAETSVRNGKRADAEHRITEFHTLWMRIVSARNAGAFVGQSPPVRFRVNKRVWGDSDPSNVWLR